MLAGLSYNIFLCFHQSVFRSSNSTDTWINALKTAIQIVCMWTLTFAVIPYVLLESFGLKVIGATAAAKAPADVQEVKTLPVAGSALLECHAHTR